MASIFAPAIIPPCRFRRWEGIAGRTGTYGRHEVAQIVYHPWYQVVHGFRALSRRRGIIKGAGERVNWYKERRSI
ncbi:MAG: hypothetical protein LKJ31_01845 [Atopobiaceae bacterium]|nr:hypothetical protein [Atopobiaceae bacterium]